MGSLAGSLSGSLSGHLSPGGSTPDTTAPTVDSIALAADGLSTSIVFSEELAPLGDEDGSDFWGQFVFTVQGLGIDLPLQDGSDISGNTVTLPHQLLPRDVVMALTYTKGGNDTYWLKDAAGNYVEDFTDEPVDTSAGPVDETAPEVTAARVYFDAGYGVQVLELTLDSWMNTDEWADNESITLGGTGASDLQRDDILNQTNGTCLIVFGIYDGTVFDGETVTATLASIGGTFQDLAGNDLEDFEDMAVDNQSEAVRPTATSALAASEAFVRVVFSEPMDTGSTPNIGAWSFGGTAATGTGYEDAGWLSSTVLAINTSIPVVGGLGETINYDPSGSPLRTADDREVSAFDDLEIEAD